MYPYPEVRSAMVAAHFGELAAGSFVPSAFEDLVFTSDLIYEYLAREVNGTFGPRLPNRPVYSPSTSCAYSGFAKPPFLLGDTPFSPSSPSSPAPWEPSSPQHSKRSPPNASCRRGTPSFDCVQEKWNCSVCKDAFHDRYECERHIWNAGKRAMCLACEKTMYCRKDNLKRHYTNYCKRMDLGRDGFCGYLSP